MELDPVAPRGNDCPLPVQALESLRLYIQCARKGTGGELGLAGQIDLEIQVVGPVCGSIGSREPLGKQRQGRSCCAQWRSLGKCRESCRRSRGHLAQDFGGGNISWCGGSVG
jgi:hypothetical protein